MNISEISNGTKDISVEATVKEVEEPRQVNTKFGMNSVANAVIEDSTGEIALVLWGNRISTVKAGDKVKVTGAYATEWNSRLQLNIPKTGELTVG
ncbi:MAG: OB-fold nucleic acid binding domain-containing protein [Candidatus Micrarchaeota archaeon]